MQPPNGAACLTAHRTDATLPLAFYKELSDMADLGNKHECLNCGTKFYDLGRSQLVCPSCGGDQEELAKGSAEEGQAAGKPSAKKAKKAKKAKTPKKAKKAKKDKASEDEAEDTSTTES